MNVLQKAQLIKELHELINHLENRSLNFFEIAKSKNRVKQIFSLCDEPIFHKQQSDFKLRSQPKESALEFAQQSTYALSFVGYFEHETELAEQFTTLHQLGWGMLRNANASWKIMVYTPQLTEPWQSTWGQLEQSFSEMQSQQASHGLLADEDLLHTQNALEEIPIINPDELKNVINTSSPYNFNETLVNETDEPELEQEQEQEPIIAIEAELSAPELNIDDRTPSSIENFELSTASLIDPIAPPMQVVHTAVEEIEELITPDTINLFKLRTRARVIQPNSTAEDVLFALNVEDIPEIDQHVTILMPANALDTWQNMPVALAEQIDPDHKFIKYILLFGAHEHSYAMRMLNQYCRHTDQHIAAIKEISLNSLGMDFTDANLLFIAYQQRASLLWSMDHYYPYIPVHLVHTQKFILFEEAPATQSTPVLLLLERNKNRVIHGENRMALDSSETAYPYLLLNRQHDITWQRIHNIILEMPQPIDVLTLYQTLKQIEVE